MDQSSLPLRGTPRFILKIVLGVRTFEAQIIAIGLWPFKSELSGGRSEAADAIGDLNAVGSVEAALMPVQMRAPLDTRNPSVNEDMLDILCCWTS